MEPRGFTFGLVPPVKPPASTRTVTCPACKGPSAFEPGNPWRPFCSQRCREHDLGAWASESYRVETRPDAAEPPEADSEPPAPIARH